MDVVRRILLTAGAVGAVLLLLAGPVAAETDEQEPADEPVDEPVEDGAEDEAADEADEGGRIQLAESPRDRIGLILLAALLLGGGAAAANARRQMKGERPQATGEFRWR